MIEFEDLFQEFREISENLSINTLIVFHQFLHKKNSTKIQKGMYLLQTRSGFSMNSFALKIVVQPKWRTITQFFGQSFCLI